MKTLIQLGCNTGSDILDFVKASDYDFILLVDANPFCIEAAKNLFKNVQNVYYDVQAISAEAKPVTFYIPHYEIHKTSAHSSLSKSHVLKHGHDEQMMKEIQMQSITFNDLMKRHSLSSVDRLYIDCEGEDVPIVLSIDFTSFQINYIKYEHGHASEKDKQKAVQYLQDNGYVLEISGGDTIATKS